MFVHNKNVFLHFHRFMARQLQYKHGKTRWKTWRKPICSTLSCGRSIKDDKEQWEHASEL